MAHMVSATAAHLTLQQGRFTSISSWGKVNYVALAVGVIAALGLILALTGALPNRLQEYRWVIGACSSVSIVFIAVCYIGGHRLYFKHFRESQKALTYVPPESTNLSQLLDAPTTDFLNRLFNQTNLLQWKIDSDMLTNLPPGGPLSFKIGEHSSSMLSAFIDIECTDEGGHPGIASLQISHAPEKNMISWAYTSKQTLLSCLDPEDTFYVSLYSANNIFVCKRTKTIISYTDLNSVFLSKGPFPKLHTLLRGEGVTITDFQRQKHTIHLRSSS